MSDAKINSAEIINEIKSSLHEKNYEIINFNLQAGSVKGDNYLGEITRILVTCKTVDGQYLNFDWILKCAPTDQGFRSVFYIDKMFKREIYFYTEVVPDFLNFQKGKKLKKPFTNFTPIHLTSTEHLQEYILMENMKSKGFYMKNRHELSTYEHILTVVREYGRLHAISFAIRDQMPEVFQKHRDNMLNNMFSFGEPKNQANRMDSYFARGLTTLNKENDGEAIEKLQKCRRDFLNKFRNIFDYICEEHCVITHGDSWNNNILCKDNVSESKC